MTKRLKKTLMGMIESDMEELETRLMSLVEAHPRELHKLLHKVQYALDEKAGKGLKVAVGDIVQFTEYDRRVLFGKVSRVNKRTVSIEGVRGYFGKPDGVPRRVRKFQVRKRSWKTFKEMHEAWCTPKTR